MFNQCLDIHFYPSYDERCSFAQLNRDCNSSLSLIDYNRFLYCGFAPERAFLGIVICVSESDKQENNNKQLLLLIVPRELFNMSSNLLVFWQIVWALILFLALAVTATDL